MRQKRLRPQMGLGIMAIGAIRTRVSPNSILSLMAEAIAGYRGSPQMDSGSRIIGAISRGSHGLQTIADRMAAGPLLSLIKGIGPVIKIHQGRIADGGQEDTAAGGRRRRRRRSSSSAAPKAPLPRGSPRSRSAGGSKGEGMMGSP